MKTKEQIVALIQETIDFYSINSNRSIKGGIGCCYFNVQSGNKCAVGRCLSESALEIVSKEEAKSFESSFGFITLTEMTKGDTFREEYQGFDDVIWQGLQSLHDITSNWLNPYGVSSDGIQFMNYKFPEYIGLFVFNKPMTENPYYKSDV